VVQEADEPSLVDRIKESRDIGVQYVVHLRAVDPDIQGVQRIVLTALGSESVREPEEFLLVDRVQHGDRGSLDDLILQSGDRERALTAIRLRDVLTPRGPSPVRSSVDLFMQRREILIEVCLVGPPRQPIHAGSGVPLEFAVRQPEQRRADMVEESGELIRCPLLCCLSYAAQRLGHTYPVLSPARVALIRISLGPRPSLHWLRRWLPSFVRRLRRYYGGV
jgi:hypothetical protein